MARSLIGTKEYFALIEKHPKLAKILAFSIRIRVVLGDLVVEVGDTPATRQSGPPKRQPAGRSILQPGKEPARLPPVEGRKIEAEENLMMIRSFTLLTITAALAAQESRPETKLPRVIRQLAAADEAVAKEAMRSLIRGGKPAAKALRKALASSKDARFKQRIQRILPLCEVEAPVQRGLKLGLAADRSKLTTGDKVNLTVTRCNVTDRDIEIYNCMSYAGDAFTNGSQLRWIEQNAKSGKPVEHGPRWTVGFCGTGAYAKTLRIPALAARKFQVVATYTARRQSKPNGQSGPAKRLLKLLYCTLELGADDGELTVQLRHESHEPDAGWLPKGVRREKVNWIGTLRSNQLVLRTKP